MYRTHHCRTTFGSWDVEKVHAKHISKSKCTKHTMYGPFLEVQMSKKCTLLRREAHFEVKMLKTPGFRTTFGGSDVASLHYTTGHYITLRYTPVHCTALHYTTLHNTTTTTTQLHSTTLHYTPPHSTTLNHTTLHYTTLRSTTPHYITLHYTTFNYTSLHYTTLHSTTRQLQLHNYTPLQYAPLH